jgi:hypothetical protein
VWVIVVVSVVIVVVFAVVVVCVVGVVCGVVGVVAVVCGVVCGVVVAYVGVVVVCNIFVVYRFGSLVNSFYASNVRLTMLMFILFDQRLYSSSDINRHQVILEIGVSLFHPLNI